MDSTIKLVAKTGLIASLLSFALSACAGGSGGGSGNNLDVGYSTKAPESVNIVLSGLMNYNGKTAEELYALRSKNVAAHPELLGGSSYKPSPDVFAIDSKSPWWSMKGYLFRSMIVDHTGGVSRESAYFGNPFLLVSPEWYGNDLHIPSGRFPNGDAFANVYPTYVPPMTVKIVPKEKREELSFEIMSYYNNVKSIQDGLYPITQIGFDLCAYNARDFGYNYIYVDANNTSNINKLPPEVISINQALGAKTRNTCAPSCNDEIGTPDELVGFRVKNIPAKIRLLLWQKKPTSHLAPHDFQVDMFFK